MHVYVKKTTIRMSDDVRKFTFRMHKNVKRLLRITENVKMTTIRMSEDVKNNYY